MEKLVFCHFIDLEIGCSHSFCDLFRKTETDKASLRIDDGHRKMAASYAFRFIHGIGHGISPFIERAGRTAIGDENDDGILRRILSIEHIEYILCFEKTFGKRRLTAGRHRGKFLLCEIHASCDREKNLSLFLTESDHADTITFLIRIEKDLEDDTFDRFHTFPSTHGTRGIDNEKENIPRTFFTHFAAKVIFSDDDSTSIRRTGLLIRGRRTQRGIESNVACLCFWDFRTYITPLHKVSHGKAALAAPFLWLSVLGRLDPHRRQIDMEICRIDTFTGSSLRIRHLSIGIILILIALAVFRIRLLRLRLLRSCKILFTL